MNWLPKLLRRVIVLWCLYGLVRLLQLVHPCVVKLALSCYAANPDFAADEADAVLGMWAIILSGSVALMAVLCAVHYFSKWLFNERR